MNRGRRVVLPYMIFAAFSLCLMGVLYLLLGERAQTQLYSGVSKNFIRAFWGRPVFLRYTGHLWFIQVYFILMVLLPLQRKIIDWIGGWKYMILCFIVSVAVIALDVDILPKYFIYNFPLIVGLIVYRDAHCLRNRILGVTVGAGLVVGVKATGMHFLPMQGHKWDGDIMYFSWNILALSLLSFFYPLVKKIPYGRVVRFWNENGFTLYLYQTFSYWLVFLLIGDVAFESKVLGCTVWVFLIFVVSSVLGVCFVAFEKFVVGILGRIRLW